jgi:ATP-dependent exoDNAse (exonuclease V) beta subunit
MSAHTLRLQEDEQNRIRALELSSFIVEAPAGAGKTELLTQRYLKLLQTVQAPEEIIAITFTNKAASEMKKRIMDSFEIQLETAAPHKRKTYELAQKALARSDELGWDLLHTPSRLRIYTIDSFSSNLARQMPLLSRFGSQPAVSEDASLYYQEAATRALANLDDAEHGHIVQEALRYFDNDHYKLNQLLADMLAKRDQWLPYDQTHNSEALAEAALTHLVTQDMLALESVLPLSIQKALMPVARYAASNLDCEHPIALLRDWETPIPHEPKALVLWHGLVELLLTGTGTLRSRADKNIGLPAVDEAKPYKEKWLELIETLRQNQGAEAALANLKRLPNPRFDQQTWKIVDTLATLLKIAAAQLWLVFQQHGEVDFVQISQRALFALGDAEENPTDLALKLDYQIQHLLVDEFQDTSPTQIKLIEHLMKGWIEGDGRTMFAVGDPMQSIYRFRKANVGLFLRAAQRGIGSVSLTPLKLWRNNRSQKPVIAWINNAFTKVFPKEDSVSRGAIAYRDFVATKDTEEQAGVFVHAMLDRSLLDKAAQSNADEEDGAEPAETDVRQLEANKIIKIIQDTWAENPERKIAVLVRARSHLHALVAEIRRNHPSLSFQAVEIEELANRQVVQDLLSLTNALHQRADRMHWLAILRAPWCGLTLKDMHALIGRDQYSTVLSLMHDDARLQNLSEDGRQRLLHVRQVMDEALLHRGRMSTSRWVRSVWLMLSGPNCLWNSGDVRDVQAFFERIDRMEAVGQFTTELLAQEVQKLYAAPDAKATDRLQFMTIHKSKGLEFDTVILPGLDKTTGGNEQPLLIWEEVSQEALGADITDVDLVVAPLPPKGKAKKEQATPYGYLQALEKQRAEYEDARVLYVAATRAERCLHLLGAVKLDKNGQAKPKKNTFLEMLWPVVTPDFDLDNLLKIDEAVINQQPKAGKRLEEFVPQLVRLVAPQLPDALNTDVALNIPINQQNDELVSIAPSLEADIGTLTHRYLELIARQGIGAWTIARVGTLQPAMQRWLIQQGHQQREAAQGAEMVASLINTALQSREGKWVLQLRDYASQELALEYFDGEAVKKRIIDRTFVEQGTRWIIDYKTTWAVSDLSDDQLQQAAAAHQAQLKEYAALFAHKGLPIKTAVFFVNIGRLIEIVI